MPGLRADVEHVGVLRDPRSASARLRRAGCALSDRNVAPQSVLTQMYGLVVVQAVAVDGDVHRARVEPRRHDFGHEARPSGSPAAGRVMFVHVLPPSCDMLTTPSSVPVKYTPACFGDSASETIVGHCEMPSLRDDADLAAAARPSSRCSSRSAFVVRSGLITVHESPRSFDRNTLFAADEQHARIVRREHHRRVPVEAERLRAFGRRRRHVRRRSAGCSATRR